jgi:hypothetical protein
MASLVPPPKGEKRRLRPAELRPTILDAKREHPPLNVHELATICWARYGHRPSRHTVKRILAESPPPPRAHRRFPPYHAVADPTQRRPAIVRLHVGGRNASSIQPDQRRLQTVTPEQRFETPHRSPQRPLWTWDEDEWRPVLRLPAHAPRRPRTIGAVQPPLFAPEVAGT